MKTLREYKSLNSLWTFEDKLGYVNLYNHKMNELLDELNNSFEPIFANKMVVRKDGSLRKHVEDILKDIINEEQFKEYGFWFDTEYHKITENYYKGMIFICYHSKLEDSGVARTCMCDIENGYFKNLRNTSDMPFATFDEDEVVGNYYKMVGMIQELKKLKNTLPYELWYERAFKI